MAKLYDLAVMTVSGTPGTGTITLNAAASINGVSFLTFALAGVANGDVVDYAIQDPMGGGSEIGTGTYTSSGTTLTRTPTKSTNSNAAINASSASLVLISPRAETLNDASLITTGTVATARLGSGTASSTTALFGDQTYKTITTNGVVQNNVYASSQTITIPAGATRAKIRMWGGTGGGKAAACCGVASSGAGAGYVEKYLTGFTPGNTLVLTVGAAGATTGAGGSSTLVSGTQTITTLTASGGGAGATSALNTPGTGTNGDINLAGQPGVLGGAAGCPGGMSGGGVSVGGKGGSTNSVGIVGGCSIDWLS
jgi:hypothetical protein